MKTRKIYSTALLALIGASTFAAPLLASAEDATSSVSKGSVKVEEGTAGGPDQPTIDPENPGKDIPKVDPTSPNPGENINPTAGPLTIERTTDLKFGTVKTSGNDVTAYAAPMVLEDKSTRGVYVQFADVRAGGTYGYTVTAELSKQFTSASGEQLKGSTINFANPVVARQKQANDTTANNFTMPTITNNNFTLAEGAEATTVVTADKEAKQGKGRYIMEFGQSKDAYKDPTNPEAGTIGEDAATDAKSVELTIPAATASDMSAADYEAEVTWKIVAGA